MAFEVEPSRATIQVIGSAAVRPHNLKIASALCSLLICACAPPPEPSEISGGCGGGKPDQGGTSFTAKRSEGTYTIEVAVHGFDESTKTSHVLAPEQWQELVEIVRNDKIMRWKPVSEGHADCMTCRVRVDQHEASYCGQLSGEDRGRWLRTRLQSLARDAGWEPVTVRRGQ
jgi:hypothetical protein